MRHFSYRSKQRLRVLLIALAIAAAVLAVTAVCVVLYLERYIVYTADGAHLDFSIQQGAADGGGGEALPPLADAPLTIGSGGEDQSAMDRLEGVYVTVEMLADTAAVETAVAGQPAVLVDLKSIYGNYYYSSALSGAETSSAVSPTAVDALLAQLAARRDLYRVARVPAFRDSAFALANQSCGLALSGGALWMDESSCYWLDPADDQVIAHLADVARELHSLGFDEVVFSDFSFPESANIVYDGDRSAAVLEAASRLQANLAEEGITFSVETEDPALAAYAARVYISEEDGARVQGLADAFSAAYDVLEERLVFVTASRDTRFAQYGIFRPALDDEES